MHICVCVCVCLSTATCLHYCTDPDVTWGSGKGCPIVVHYWVDLQSVHGLRCCGNITRTQNVSEYMLVLFLCLVEFRKCVHEFVNMYMQAWWPVTKHFSHNNSIAVHNGQQPLSSATFSEVDLSNDRLILH